MQDERKKTIQILALIGLAAVVAYLPALGAGFVWDDDSYVEDNKTLKTWGGIKDIWSEPESIPQYYPLTHTTFWIEYRLWGDSPLGYHLTNLALHVGSVFLLFRVLRMLMIPGALLAAAVFALHPVMVESVAWVTERKNVLSMLFYLLAARVFLQNADSETPTGRWRRPGAWPLMFVLFLCALTSKSVTFSLPFGLLLIMWWKNGRVSLFQVGLLTPLMVVGAAYGMYTREFEHTHVGAAGAEWSETLLQKFLIAGRVPWFYLHKLVWPAELTFIYERWIVDPAQAWQWLFPAGVVLLLAGLVVVAWKGGIRGPLAAFLFFGGTLFPAIGFIDVFPFRYSFVADHFQYHASLGIIVLFCAIVARLVPARSGLPFAVIVAVIVLTMLGVRTWVQCEKYESREVLYDSILVDVPDSWFAHNNLAAIYVMRDEIDKGFAFYKRAKQLHPSLTPAGPTIKPEAFAHCATAKIMANNHSLRPAAEAWNLGRHDEAMRIKQEIEPWLERIIARFEAALKINPEYVDAMKDLARMWSLWATVEPNFQLADQRRKIALRLLEKALRSAPGNSEVRQLTHNLHVRIGQVYERLGEAKESKAHFMRANQIRAQDPDR